MVVDGEIVIDGPFPTKLPPQLPLYHAQSAPVPNEPPATVSVVVPPLHIVVIPVTPVGATEGLLTVTVT